MTISVKQGTTKNSTYNVEGADLDKIWKDIEKRGPKAGSKNVAAATVTPLEMSFQYKSKYTPNKKDPSTNDAVFWISDGTLGYHGEVLMPKLKSDKALSKPAKKEWKRFIGKVADHEKEHVDKIKAELKNIAAEMEKIIGASSDADGDTAMAEAEKAFNAEFEKQFGGKSLDDRLNKIHTDFDSASKHGAKHGATLKVSVS